MLLGLCILIVIFVGNGKFVFIFNNLNGIVFYVYNYLVILFLK